MRLEDRAELVALVDSSQSGYSERAFSFVSFRSPRALSLKTSPSPKHVIKAFVSAQTLWPFAVFSPTTKPLSTNGQIPKAVSHDMISPGNS